MYIRAYVYTYIYTCIYIHIYMFVHVHTYTYIYTHVQHVHMHTRKHAWNDSVAATAREAQLEARKLHPSSCLRSSSYHHDNTPPRLHPLICTGVGPIHPIHGHSGRGPRRSCPEIGFTFHFPAVFWIFEHQHSVITTTRFVLNSNEESATLCQIEPFEIQIAQH